MRKIIRTVLTQSAVRVVNKNGMPGLDGRRGMAGLRANFQCVCASPSRAIAERGLYPGMSGVKTETPDASIYTTDRKSYMAWTSMQS